MEGRQVFPELIEQLGNQPRTLMAVRVASGNQGAIGKEPREAGGRKTGHSSILGMNESQPILCPSVTQSRVKVPG